MQSWSSLRLEPLVQLHLLWVLPFDGHCLAAAAAVREVLAAVLPFALRFGVCLLQDKDVRKSEC